MSQLVVPCLWHLLSCFFHLLHFAFQSPDVINQPFYSPYHLRIRFLLIVQEPRPFLCLWHIREDEDRVIARMFSEVRFDTPIGRKSLVLQSVVVNELRLVNQQPREREGVRRARSVLRDDDCARAVIERDDVFIFCRLDNRLGKCLRRSSSDDIVYPPYISPSFPRCQQSRQRIRQSMFESRHHDAPCAARHPLHIAQHERSRYRVCFPCSSARHDDRDIRADELCEALWLVEVHFI